MSVYDMANALGVSEQELFIRAQRAFGPTDRSKIDSDFIRYIASGHTPDYVIRFLHSHQQDAMGKVQEALNVGPLRNGTYHGYCPRAGA